MFLPNSYVHHALRNFRVRLLSPLSMSSIVSYPPSFKTSLPLNAYMVISFLLSLKTIWLCLFVLLQPHDYTQLEPRARLCYFLNYDIEHIVFVAKILSWNDFASHALLPLANIVCSLISPKSVQKTRWYKILE